MLEPALPRPPRGPARLARLNLGLVELLEVWADDRAVELPADAAEVGEDGRQASQRRVEQLAQLVVLGVLLGFLFLACCWEFVLVRLIRSLLNRKPPY